MGQIVDRYRHIVDIAAGDRSGLAPLREANKLSKELDTNFRALDRWRQRDILRLDDLSGRKPGGGPGGLSRSEWAERDRLQRRLEAEARMLRSQQGFERDAATKRNLERQIAAIEDAVSASRQGGMGGPPSERTIPQQLGDYAKGAGAGALAWGGHTMQGAVGLLGMLQPLVMLGQAMQDFEQRARQVTTLGMRFNGAFGPINREVSVAADAFGILHGEATGAMQAMAAATGDYNIGGSAMFGRAFGVETGTVARGFGAYRRAVGAFGKQKPSARLAALGTGRMVAIQSVLAASLGSTNEVPGLVRRAGPAGQGFFEGAGSAELRRLTYQQDKQIRGDSWDRMKAAGDENERARKAYDALMRSGTSDRELRLAHAFRKGGFDEAMGEQWVGALGGMAGFMGGRGMFAAEGAPETLLARIGGLGSMYARDPGAAQDLGQRLLGGASQIGGDAWAYTHRVRALQGMGPQKIKVGDREITVDPRNPLHMEMLMQGIKSGQVETGGVVRGYMKEASRVGRGNQDVTRRALGRMLGISDAEAEQFLQKPGVWQGGAISDADVEQADVEWLAARSQMFRTGPAGKIIGADAQTQEQMQGLGEMASNVRRSMQELWSTVGESSNDGLLSAFKTLSKEVWDSATAMGLLSLYTAGGSLESLAQGDVVPAAVKGAVATLLAYRSGRVEAGGDGQ